MKKYTEREYPAIASLPDQPSQDTRSKTIIIITKYKLEYNQEECIAYVRADEDVVCPICGNGAMKQKGRRKRNVRTSDGIKQKLSVRHLKCKGCGKTHRELPDIVVPYKQECAETIEKVINGDTAEVGCEDSTINRIKAWWSNIMPYIRSVLLSIREKHSIAIELGEMGGIKLRQIVRALVNTHLWPSAQSVLAPG